MSGPDATHVPMPADSSRAPAPKEPLPLAGRYQAAWSEHSTRVAQRQAVVQMYLTTAGVIFGFWFTHNPSGGNQAQVDKFLTVGITILTFCSSLLMWLHNRVMFQLSNFMKNCEKSSAQSINQCGGGVNLFYFYDKDSKESGPKEVDRFHLHQRRYNRAVLAFIFSVTNIYAITLTHGRIDGAISLICVAALVVAILVLLSDLLSGLIRI